MAEWQFWVDRGGTFTDLIARTPGGRYLTRKLLSEAPERYQDAVLQGIADVLEASSVDNIPSEKIASVRLGTTVATNALLERKGARTLLVTTRGFADALKIGYQNRPDLFALKIEVPEPLYAEVLEVDERIAADGTVIQELNCDTWLDSFRQARRRGVESVAIVLMNAYRNNAHELALGAVAERAGLTHVRLSHQVSNLIKYVGRGDTTVVDAYVSPVFERYVERLSSRLAGTRLMFMQSSGGLAEARDCRARDSLLSGPAGGVVGGVQTSVAEGHNQVLGFDMGGTSTDVWHYDGQYERVYDTELAGARLRVPMLDIHTVAAGGGSICHYDGSKLRVGPDSAGANPGPACYGRGGPLTITDCNLLLGKLNPEYFPAVFGTAGDEPLDTKPARDRLDAIVEQVRRGGGNAGTRISALSVARGFIDIAIEGMASAIKKVSTERGRDVADYALACFGGAAGQHACGVADRLGLHTILIHPMAGVLSALGMGLADLSTLVERSLEWPLDAENVAVRLNDVIEALKREALANMTAPADVETIEWQTTVYLRYRGSDTAMAVPVASPLAMGRAFEAAHRARFSFVHADQPVVVDSVAVEAVARGERPGTDGLQLALSGLDIAPGATTRWWLGEQWRSVAVFDRQILEEGDRVAGPAMVIDAHATTIIEEGWRCEVLASGTLRLLRVDVASHRAAGSVTGADRQTGVERDPVTLELFNYRFMAIAEQMGAVLVNTAHSVNIKERLDFSCALFDARGNLIANAPHVPVHLGSMGDTVTTIIDNRRQKMTPGDAYLVNSPYGGGTHLPDMTVVSPVFASSDSVPVFYVATRAHHADIGGIAPGSIPAVSSHIEQEGVLFEDFHLVRQGHFDVEALRSHLTGGAFPARNPDSNIADLQAQVAANALGRGGLEKLVEQHGFAVVDAYATYVQDNAAEAVQRVIETLRDGHFRYAMDHGAEIVVSTRVDASRKRLTVDFSGTSAQRVDNFNAPESVVKAAVLYVLRTLVEDAIPLNAGCLRPVDLVIPAGSMLSPRYPAAVVAGNVETSQYVADALYGALDRLAGSQGTMNNLTFGNERVQYYETICGGAGAGYGFAGASAVQVHMTNSRLTDPEILELRFPVRLEAFAVRAGSGGAGRYSGGDGVIRCIRFLETLRCSLVCGHRRVPVFGLHGGGEGMPGSNLLIRANGDRVPLSGVEEFVAEPGDVIVVETPGGGGYGTPGA